MAYTDLWNLPWWFDHHPNAKFDVPVSALVQRAFGSRIRWWVSGAIGPGCEFKLLCGKNEGVANTDIVRFKREEDAVAFGMWYQSVAPILIRGEHYLEPLDGTFRVLSRDEEPPVGRWGWIRSRSTAIGAVAVVHLGGNRWERVP
jgi:hypothetical protein